MLFAQERQRLSVDRIADLVGESKWTIYKWMQSGNVPARKIAGFEHACGAYFVSGYLAGCSHRLVIDMPCGRRAGPGDIQALQEACTAAIGAVISFSSGRCDSRETIDLITAAIARLAHERAQVERAEQPELGL